MTNQKGGVTLNGPPNVRADDITRLVADENATKTLVNVLKKISALKCKVYLCNNMTDLPHTRCDIPGTCKEVFAFILIRYV